MLRAGSWTSLIALCCACGFQPSTAAHSGDGGDGTTDSGPAPTCTDGAKNGDETGVDCGGSCAACTSCATHAIPPAVNVPTGMFGAKFLTSPTWTCNAAGTTTIDSAAGTVTSTSCSLGTPDLSANVAQLDAAGPHVFVVRLRGLTISNNHLLKVVGTMPVVILVAGDVLVDTGGVIDASATGGTAGPGGSPTSCIDNASGLGASASGTGWGGGGGGFGTPGGQGCYNLINGGSSTGSALLAPLRGGCAGATSAGSGQAGAGGGALEISASGTITIGSAGAATIVASGGGGKNASGGGNGGGAGGGILIAAPTLPVVGSSGALRAHGGAGTEGKSSGSTNDGDDGHKTDNNAATDSSNTAGGGNGNDHGRTGGLAYVVGAAALVTMPGNMTTAQTGGRGGGGGGGGRIVISTATPMTSCD